MYPPLSVTMMELSAAKRPNTIGDNPMNTPTQLQASRDSRFGAEADLDRAWQLAAAAALGWLGVGIFGGWWSLTDDDDGDGSLYLLFSIVLMLSALLTVAAAWTSTRSAERATVRKCALAVGFLAATSTLVAWAGPLWMTMIAACLVLFALAGPAVMRPGLAALAVGQILGIVVTIGAMEAEIGAKDSYGDYSGAADLGIVVAAAGSVIGLTLLVRVARAARVSW